MFLSETECFTAGVFDDNVKVFTGKKIGTYFSLTAQSNTIPAQTAVVLKGAEGYYSFTPASSAPAITGENDLLGTAAPLTASGAEYVLASEGGVAGFYQALTGSVIPAGKAYLTSASHVNAFVFTEDDPTGINEINGQWSMANGQSIYNLAGQRLSKMQKGINIVSGKKMLK